MKKVALVAFNGDPMCFVHVLLNTIDMKAKGWDVRVIIEGTATKTIVEMNESTAAFHQLYKQVREADLIDCVCKACSLKMGVLDEIIKQGLFLSDELHGHPSIARYIDEGFEIITF